MTPVPTLGAMGVTAMETIVAGVTARVAEPVAPRKANPMVVVPAPTPCAWPDVLIVATAVFSELQVPEFVTSWCERSLSVAVAV